MLCSTAIQRSLSSPKRFWNSDHRLSISDWFCISWRTTYGVGLMKDKYGSMKPLD